MDRGKDGPEIEKSLAETFRIIFAQPQDQLARCSSSIIRRAKASGLANKSLLSSS
jgi:hypothetical protein